MTRTTTAKDSRITLLVLSSLVLTHSSAHESHQSAMGSYTTRLLVATKPTSSCTKALASRGSMFIAGKGGACRGVASSN